MQCSTNWAMKPRCEQIKRQFNLYSLYEDVFLVVSKVKCKSFWYTVFCMSNPLQYLNSILANKTFSSGSCHFGMDLLFHYHVSLSKLNMKIARTWTVFSNNVNTTIRKCSSRAFIWVLTPLGFLDSSGFRSFLGLIKFVFGRDRVKCRTSCTRECAERNWVLNMWSVSFRRIRSTIQVYSFAYAKWIY